jgi:hypothetical protein
MVPSLCRSHGQEILRPIRGGFEHFWPVLWPQLTTKIFCFDGSHGFSPVKLSRPISWNPVFTVSYIFTFPFLVVLRDNK